MSESLIRLDGQRSSYVIDVSGKGMPLCRYWGWRLPRAPRLGDVFRAVQGGEDGRGRHPPLPGCGGRPGTEPGSRHGGGIRLPIRRHTLAFRAATALFGHLGLELDVRKLDDAERGDIDVIKGVDLDLEHGEFVVFVGPSGCGKSTLLRLIAGLEDITSGDLYIGGTRVNDLAPARRGISMVFQSYALFPHMTVEENMGFGLKLAKVPKAEIDAKVKEAARILQLGPLLKRKPKDMSGGQRQRVAIGRSTYRGLRPDLLSRRRVRHLDILPGLKAGDSYGAQARH